MSQRGFAEAGGAIEQYMVQRFASAAGSDDGYVEISLDFVLPGKVIKVAGPQAGIKRHIFGAGFARCNASYLTSPPHFPLSGK